MQASKRGTAAELTAPEMVPSLSGDSMTMKERFSGGGGDMDWSWSRDDDEDEEDEWLELVVAAALLSMMLNDEAPPVMFDWSDNVDEEDNKALAAVRLIPLLVQGTAADCILSTTS